MTDTMDFESIRIFKPQNSTTNENRFRYLVNDNAMATEKTAEGIASSRRIFISWKSLLPARLA